MYNTSRRYGSLSDLTPEQLADLQNPDSWDWEHAQQGTPNPGAGIVYRVRFQGDEVRAIDEAARARGISEIEFIRQASIAAARMSRQPAR
jgi:hypothetical protein